MTMAENSQQSDAVFIDVATSSQKFTFSVISTDSVQPVEGDQNISIKKEINRENGVQLEKVCKSERASPLPPGLEIAHRRIRCKECPKYAAENEEQMLRHIRKVHRGENPFQCYMCDYSTYNKCLFEEHVRIHQGIKPFKCAHCPYRSVSKKNTKKHELIHRPDNPHKCQQCGFIARHLRSLRCHLNSAHSMDKESEKLLVRCDECNKKFEDYESHRKNRIQCSSCDQFFCNRNLAKKHMLEMHREQNRLASADFVCAICKWSSNVRPKILLHLIHHPNQPVDKEVVDVHILKECGIVGPGW